MLRKRVRVLFIAICLELALYALVIASPKDHGWLTPLAALLLPGLTLQFFVGGGMSMVDGLSPRWRTDLAFAAGFALNALVAFGLCLLASRLVKHLRELVRAR